MQNRILIVEDEDYIRELYKRQLEQAGYLVDTAADGRSAQEMLSKNSYDLVLLDIMLPGVDGMTLLKQIKENEKTKNAKVVMLTNLGQQDLATESFRRGALDYIVKIKNTPDKIVAKVQKYLST